MFSPFGILGFLYEGLWSKSNQRGPGGGSPTILVRVTGAMDHGPTAQATDQLGWPSGWQAGGVLGHFGPGPIGPRPDLLQAIG